MVSVIFWTTVGAWVFLVVVEVVGLVRAWRERDQRDREGAGVS